MSKPTIGIGIIGLGFMGRTHLGAYEKAAAAGLPVRVTALCDLAAPVKPDPRSVGNLSTGADATAESAARRYAAAEDLLVDRDVQLVSICTYTDTHIDLAVRALRAGKHVLVEKPLAVRAADIEPLVSAAEAANTLCMPAMCMRFWPAWEWLRERVRDGSLGAVRSATFQRLAAPPSWSQDFYRDPARSGGALIDLHIHDTDFVRWCFGDPQDVRSTGTIHHLTTCYEYPGGPPHVTAEGGWDHTPGMPFAMRYLVVFERATAAFDIARTPQLLLYRDGNAEEVSLSPLSGYEVQVQHLLRAISEDRRDIRVTVRDALATARLLEREGAQLRKA